MKPAPFDYAAPESIDEAISHLAEAGPDAVVLAGGQTLVPLLALRMATPSVVVDINRVAALQGVTRTDQGIRVAACTRQKMVLTDDTVRARLPLLAHVVHHVGHIQTRARGTVGGSIVTGEPAAELPATSLALGASLEVRSESGTRTVAADDLYIGPYATSLAPGELVTAVNFPALPVGSIAIFREVARRPGDFALVGLVGYITRSQGKITQAGLAWFGMGPMPMKLRRAEAALIGQSENNIDIPGLTALAMADAEPLDDNLATAAYRQQVGRRVFADALQRAFEGKAAA
jgi:carbon-monoxide dehydrogenase medium subunit